MGASHREQPLRRVNPSGRVVWVARYTGRDGKRRSAGTFQRRRDAQDAIDAAYERPVVIDSVGAYFERWPVLHPRAKRTQDTNEHRVSRALDVELEGRPLRDWLLRDLRRRHAHELVDVLLTDQGRAALGAAHIVNAVALMIEDAILDELVGVNAFRGVRVRATDPRVTKDPREIRVWSWEQMHAFAAAAGRWEPMVRVFTDCGLRLGEVLPLERGDFDGEVLFVRRTAHEGKVQLGTKTDHGETSPGRIVPVSPGAAALLRDMPKRIDTDLLFPTESGLLWRERNFYRDVWGPPPPDVRAGKRKRERKTIQELAGLDIRPHEMRHSWESNLAAAGIDQADLADVAGHTVQTMNEKYRHALRRSFDDIRRAVG